MERSSRKKAQKAQKFHHKDTEDTKNRKISQEGHGHRIDRFFKQKATKVDDKIVYAAPIPIFPFIILVCFCMRIRLCGLCGLPVRFPVFVSFVSLW